MAEALKIRLAARCEAAGRPENEDNFQVAEDLSVSNTGFTTDKVFSLGSKGTLLLVCDGMGGMNAGEVASAIGVETIKNLFAPQLLTEDVLANDESVCMYMKRAIVKADSQIKEEASKDAAKQGMGSTAVMAWLLGHKVYVAWCGDSRCYRYNPSSNLEQLSHDHSYVQDLVDTGQLSADLAFDHPNKNIITRSLGDPRGAAKPDAKVYTLQKGDVIMLCSDGLSDSLRDSEIEQSIARSIASMESCRDALWNDSKQAGWHDNVTIVLAQVIDERALQIKDSQTQQIPQKNSTKIQLNADQLDKGSISRQPQELSNTVESSLQKEESVKSPSNENHRIVINWKWVTIIVGVVILSTVVGLLIFNMGNKENRRDKELQYQLLSNSFKDDMFNTLASYQNICDSIEKTKKNFDLVCGLAQELNKKDFRKDDIKKTINEAIDNKAALFENDYPDDVEKAGKIKEFKIK